MTDTLHRTSSQIHADLDHPIIDGDGHNIEFMPVFEDYIHEFAGAKAVDKYRQNAAWFEQDDETRMQKRMSRPLWWAFPTKGTVEHLTVLVPALLEERLGELGLDFLIVYPSPGRMGVPFTDSEFRQPWCRALNAYQADLLRPHSSRMTPAATIPMHNPTEALEELDYAVNVLGLKATMMPSFVQRKIPIDIGDGLGKWWDTFGLDSEYDYDPVWQKCLDLKVAPAFHLGAMGQGSRRSPTNSVYNHIGHFAAGHEPVCKSLFLGGVTRRFPELRFAFLESGVNWAASLLCDLVGHWKKRNADAMFNCDPDNIDLDIVRDVFDQFANSAMLEKMEQLGSIKDRLAKLEKKDYEKHFNEFAASGVTSLEDIRNQFIPNFFFGCEGDDPMNLLAYDKRILPFDDNLNAVYGSDIAHFDVPDMSEVLMEAHELVDDGYMKPEEFREFTFTNPIKLHAGMNPDFFKGTAVEAAVDAEIATLK